MESSRTSLAWTSSRTHFEVLGLGLGLKPRVLGLGLEASSPQKLPVLGSRTALFFEQLKFRWKTPKTSRKICEHLFCFPHLEHRRRQWEGGRAYLQLKFHQRQKYAKKAYCFLSFSFFLAFFADNSITN